MNRKLTFLQSHRSFLGGRMVFKTQSPLFDNEIDPDSDQARFEFSGKNPSALGTTRNFIIVEVERLTAKKFLKVLKELKQKNCRSSSSLEDAFFLPSTTHYSLSFDTKFGNPGATQFMWRRLLWKRSSFMERIFHDEKRIQKSVQAITCCHEESLYGRGDSGRRDIAELQFLSQSEAHIQFHPEEIRPDFFITSE